MTLEITEEWDGETFWNQEELVAFAPELATAAEMDCGEDCDCEDCMEDKGMGNCPKCGYNSYSMRERSPNGNSTCAKCGQITKSNDWYKTSKSNMDIKKMDKVIISEEKSEIWVCPHCNDKIQEKSLSGWDEVNRASQHSCGGWVIHPELSEAEKEFMKKLESKSEVEVEIEIKPDSEKEDEMDKEDDECECESPEPQESEGKKSCAKCGKKMKDSMVKAEIIKNESVSTVINNKKSNKTMLTAIADINDEYLKTAQAAEIREFLEKAAAESATKAAEQLKAIEAEKGSIAADLEKAKTELAAAKAELEKLNQEKSAAAAQELFNKRMAYFDEKFELCEDAKKAIVARVRDIKDDEAFATYQKEMEVFLKGKEKGQKQVVASVTNDDKALDTALKNAEAQKVEVLPGQVKDEPKSLYEKYRKAFEINSENYKSR